MLSMVQMKTIGEVGLEASIAVKRFGMSGIKDTAAKIGRGLGVFLRGSSAAVPRVAGKVANTTAMGFNAAGHTAEWLAKNPSAIRLGATVGIAGAGYITAGPDATTGDRLARAAGFGLIGAGAGYAASNPGIRRRLGVAMRHPFNRRSGGLVQEALGLKKWTVAHSMGAGALYGMISPHTSILGGMLGGAAIHGGAKMTRGAFANVNPMAEFGMAGGGIGGLKAAVMSLGKGSLIGAGAGLGLTMGAYRGMTHGGGLINVAANSIGGMGLGATVGAGGRMAMMSPVTALTAGLGGLMVGTTALDAGSSFMAGGGVGVHDVNADGDLALALHKTRHGF